MHSVVLLWEHEWDVLKASYDTCGEVKLWRSASAEGEEEEGKSTVLLSDPGRPRVTVHSVGVSIHSGICCSYGN